MNGQYPRFKNSYFYEELIENFLLTPAELEFVRNWVFLTKTAKGQFVSKNSDLSPAPRRPYRGPPPRD
jgi:hypothetical protein